MNQNYLNLINKKLASLTDEQLYILFQVYLNLDFKCDFFMSEESHISFMNLFLETPSNRTQQTFKTLMSLLTTQFTSKSRYPELLITLEMIQDNCTLEDIIKTLLFRE